MFYAKKVALDQKISENVKKKDLHPYSKKLMKDIETK